MIYFSQADRNLRETKRTFDSWMSSLLHLRSNPCRDFSDVTKCGYLDSIWPRNPLHYLGSAMCPDCPTKVWRGKSCGLNESGPEVDQGPGGVTACRRPCLVLFWCRASRIRLPEISVDREVFWALLGLLPPRPSQEEKRALKWMNELHNILIAILLPLLQQEMIAIRKPQ